MQRANLGDSKEFFKNIILLKDKNLRSKITKLFLLVLCFCLCVSAKTLQFIEAEGMAPVSDDLGLTRDIAILRAKQNAIEQLEIGISSQSIVEMGKLLDDIIKVQTFALIKNYKVLSERVEGNQYKVRIRACIIPKEKQRQALSNLFAHRSMTIQAIGKGSDKVKRELLKHLTKEFYFVIDPEFSKWIPDYNIIINSTIKFSHEIYDIRSYYADSEIKLVQRSNGKILITESANGIIFGLNETQAINGLRPDQFPQKIVLPLVKNFMKSFREIMYTKEHNIQITIYNLPNYNAFREFCKFIKSLRLGIKAVFDESYHDKTGSLIVRYNEKTDYLAAMVNFRTQYKINSITRDKIEIVYQGR